MVNRTPFSNSYSDDIGSLTGNRITIGKTPDQLKMRNGQAEIELMNDKVFVKGELNLQNFNCVTSCSLPITTTISGQNVFAGITNLSTSVVALNTDKANLASPEFTGKVQVGNNLIVSNNHKNYGTGVAFMAYKSVYDGASHSHAFSCTGSGNSTVNSVNNGGVYITHENVYNQRFHRNGNASFGINNSSYRLYVNGTLAHNGLSNVSDDRMKHNEKPIENGLGIVRKLNPKFYQKTNEMKAADYEGALEEGSWRYEAGLIAQDVDLIPELQHLISKPEATYDEQQHKYIDVPYSLNYQDLFVYGLAATKELDSIVASQAKVIATLEARLTALGG